MELNSLLSHARKIDIYESQQLIRQNALAECFEDAFRKKNKTFLARK